MRITKEDRILLAHGGGGQLSDELIRHYILPRFKNDTLAELADSAKLNLASKSVCFTTDSYVVKPLDFEGFTALMADLGFYWLGWNYYPWS